MHRITPLVDRWVALTEVDDARPISDYSADFKAVPDNDLARMLAQAAEHISASD